MNFFILDCLRGFLQKKLKFETQSTRLERLNGGYNMLVNIKDDDAVVVLNAPCPPKEMKHDAFKREDLS